LAAEASRSAIAVPRGAHNGHVGDDVAWMLGAVTVLAGVLGLQLQ
jgi:hypothetical protein